MTRQSLRKRSQKQLMLPFFMDPVSVQKTPDLMIVSRMGDPSEVEVRQDMVPASEEIPEMWLQAMPPVWRARLEARAEKTGAMNIWTLSSVTGVPTWRLRARLEEDCRRWMEFSSGVDALAEEEEPEVHQTRAVTSASRIERKAC